MGLPEEAARQQRKTVTLVFCDLAGSTALGDSTDPEVLEGRLTRYFERMLEIVERHGGTVEARREGAGTRVRVTLPRCPAKREAERATA